MCKDSLCKHTSPECNSYILNGSYSIITDGTFIYEYGKRNYFDPINTKSTTYRGIYKWDMNNNSCTPLIEWEGTTGSQSSAIQYYDNKIYYLETTVDGSRILKAYSLDDNKSTDILKIQDKLISSFYVSDNNIIYKEANFLYNYDTDTETHELILDNIGGTFTVRDGNIYYFTTEEKKIENTYANSLGATYTILTLNKYSLSQSS